MNKKMKKLVFAVSLVVPSFAQAQYYDPYDQALSTGQRYQQEMGRMNRSMDQFYQDTIPQERQPVRCYSRRDLLGNVVTECE